MNPRTRRIVQQSIAITCYVLAMIVVVLAFVPIQWPSWWPQIIWPAVYIPWWPVVSGISPASHYSARIFLTVALGLTIFLPQVETTFVSLMRRSSPIGSPYIDRKDFACPNCGTINRPSIKFCVKCGTPLGGRGTGTRHWGRHQSDTQMLMSLMKATLLVSAFLAFFLGLFDLTIYSFITTSFGTDGTIVFLATILSILPSVAGYLALKEGILRKYSSLKTFDKMVYSTIAWLLFGAFSLLLAVLTYFGATSSPQGVVLVLWMQLVLGILLILHPGLRRRASHPTPVTATY